MAKSNESIDPVVPQAPQAASVISPAGETKYMPPSAHMTKKGTHDLPSGNKVTNA